MKTKKNWFVIMAAMIMSSIVFMTSCSEDDEPALPEVIESEVLDEGLDSNVSSQPNTAPDGTSLGTKLSYKSWIMVKGQTRAAFENKVEVTLNNAFNNTDTTIVVPDFKLGDYTTEISYKKRSERREGFVTVSDSVLVYTVRFEQFSFDYELDHEVAFYNDGVTSQTMPYHQIGIIKDNGYKLNDLEFIIETDENERERVYLRKLLTHSISVEFNGKSYDLTAKVELRRFAGFHPCAISSELVQTGISDINNGVWQTSYSAWAEVRHVYSDGTTKVRKYTVEQMQGGISYDLQSYKTLPSADLKLVSVGFSGEGTRSRVGMPENSEVFEVKKNCVLEYNYFTIVYPTVEYEAFYDDGMLKFDYPALRYGNVSETHELRYTGSYGQEEGRPYDEYFMKLKLSAVFGETVHEVEDEFQIIVYTGV